MSCYCAPSCTIPTCTVPSCAPSPVCYPVSALGSLCGGSGSGLSFGSSSGLSSGGGAVSSGSLGIVSGASVGCIGQLPPSEMVIQPAPFNVTVPGPIISASCEPTRVGGYTACGAGGSSGGLGGGSSGGLLGYSLLGSSGSRQSCSPRVCYYPC